MTDNLTRDILTSYLGKEVSMLGTRGVRAIKNVCKSTRTNIETFCLWWTRSFTPGRLVDNIARSPKIQQEYIDWVNEKRDTAQLMANLEVDAFVAAERANRDFPLRLFQKPVRDVSPAVQYAMAGTFGVPAEVEWLKPRALRQLKEEPWYLDVMGDLKQYLPKEESNETS